MSAVREVSPGDASSDMRPRRWWAALLLSLLTTGVGQLYNGESKKALLFLLTPLLLITSSFAPRPYSWMISLAVLLGIHADAVIISAVKC